MTKIPTVDFRLSSFFKSSTVFFSEAKAFWIVFSWTETTDNTSGVILLN